MLLHRLHLACASAFVFCPIPADTDTPPVSERTVVVLSNAPHLKARVAALVKGAEGRGFRLASSEVVRDTGGGDPVIVMVWEGKDVVKTMGKLNGAGQEEYVPARSARAALTFPGYVAGLWRVRARGCIHTEGRLPPGRTPPHPGTCPFCITKCLRRVRFHTAAVG